MALEGNFGRLQLIRALKFDHVRILIDPQQLHASIAANGKPCGSAEAKGDCWVFRAALQAAVKKLLKEGLRVVLVAFPDDAIKSKWTPATSAQILTAFWTDLLQDFGSYDQDKVFFEIVNEPQLDTSAASDLENRVAKLISSVAPTHTIIATGGYSAGVDNLMDFKPLSIPVAANPNVIYTFHFYMSTKFTQLDTSPRGMYAYGEEQPANNDLSFGISSALTNTTEINGMPLESLPR